MTPATRKRHPGRRLAGFTIVEMIMTMVITAIVAGMVSVFIAGPVKGYVDGARRAALTDAADLSLRRLSREMRVALPNSLRVTAAADGNYYVEFIVTRGGGAFSPTSGFFGGSTNCATTPANCQFAVTSPMPGNPALASGASGDLIVINNTNSSDTTSQYNAYACGSLANCNIAQVSNVAGSTVTLKPGASGFNVFGFPAPSTSRFQVVPFGIQAVTYSCPIAPAKGALVRYWNYGLNGTPAAAIAAATAGSSSTTMANNASCSVAYPATAQSFGVLIVTLTLTDSAGVESVTLMREIHQDNTP